MKIIYPSFEELPEDLSSPEGMRTIAGDSERYQPEILDDVVYAVKDGKEFHLRMIQPKRTADTASLHPLLLYIQGSAWMVQNLNNSVPNLMHIVSHGFFAAIVQYRDTSIAGFPAQIEDAKTAMRYLVKEKDNYRIDIDNVFIAGDSSGGHTALGCWATWNTKELDHEKTPLPALRGVMDFYGPTDIYSMCAYPTLMNHDDAQSPEGRLIGFKKPADHPELCKQAAIRTYLSEEKAETSAPLLIMHGSKDTLVPFHQSVELYESALHLGYDVTFYKIEGADHGGSRFYSEGFEKITIAFLENHLHS